MHLFHKIRTRALTPALLLALLLTAFAPAAARAAEPRVALTAHAAQAPALRGARLVGRLAAEHPPAPRADPAAAESGRSG